MDDEQILKTMLSIQRYLDTHPESADTLDGVHYSWIGSLESKDVTQTALDLMLERGFVECLRYGRGTVLWRRARRTSPK
jgi:hypothetical protein